nr:second-largest subunit of RNA polymerase III [Cryptomonas paramecium]
MRRQYKFFNFINYHFRCQSIIWQQIESFNFFLNVGLKKIIYKFKCINNIQKNNVFYNFSNLKLGSTTSCNESTDYTITPNECRIRDISYTAPILVDVCYFFDKNFFSRMNLTLCTLPIMVRSIGCVFFNKSENFLVKFKECPLDGGGYFIIKGIERVVSIRERLSFNKINIEKDQEGNSCACVISCLAERRVKNSIILKNKKFYFRSNIFLEDILVLILYKAVNLIHGKDFIELIGFQFENILNFTVEEMKLMGIFTQKQALLYIYQRLDLKVWKYKQFFKKNIGDTYQFIKKIIFNVFSKYILIHIISQKKTQDSFYEKIVFISIMIKKILVSIDQPICIDNKDYYGNKRFELSGQIMIKLFENVFKKSIFQMEKKYFSLSKKIKKQIECDVFSFFHSSFISNSFEYSLSSGNWILSKFSQEKQGMTQILSRLSFISSISSVNKINSTYNKSTKILTLRSLYPSQWGVVCPSDTPEGESCGIIKNLSILTYISLDEKNRYIKNLCFDLGVEFFSFSEMKKVSTDMVFINNNYIGLHTNTSRFLFIFRKMRRDTMISQNVSIFWDTVNRFVFIWTDRGRACRPFFIIKLNKYINKFKKKNATKIFSWKNLQRENFIEFLDTYEQNNALIANETKKVNSKTTHLEISPEIILGICANNIPFPNHNQSPRNTYQCAMGKQSIGFIGLNQIYRTDTILSLLVYPQKPIVGTKITELSGNNRLTGGINACICVMSYGGYDIEDAMTLNRSSIQRGFMKSVLFKKSKILLKDKKELFTLYKKGQEFFFSIKKNFFSIKKKKNSNERMSYAIFPRRIENQKMYNLILTHNNHDFVFVKFVFRETRTPEIGDKFSSRHGQKGVCGIVNFYEDFPFSNEGSVPDIIMNPHGFPSRMTIGKIVELMGSKLSCLSSKFLEGTPFKKFNRIIFEKKILKLGYNKNCKDMFFSGTSGQPLYAFVFSGPVFYQKLKHMVADKIYSRSRGIKSKLTRQPVEGRNKGGGLRFGEMERDCLVSYGASELTLERLMISSDIYLGSFDMKTGIVTHVANSTKNFITLIKFPYACKLLFQELYSMNIIPRICLGFDNYNKSTT